MGALPRNTPEKSAGARTRGGEEIERGVVDFLANVFSAEGFSVERDTRGDAGADLYMRGADRTYVIEVKARSSARRSDLQGQLAAAILESSAACKHHGGKPVAVVAAPRLTSKMSDDLRRYAEALAPDTVIVLLDGRGTLTVSGDGYLEQVFAHHRERVPALGAGSRRPTSPRRSRLFTDLNQWMLKVLLAPLIEARYLAAPRNPIHGASDLAREAGVSQPTAWRFLELLEGEGYLRRFDDSLALRRVPQLLARWAVARPISRALNAVWLLPTGDHAIQLEEALAGRSSESGNQPGERACAALFSACDLLGLGHVRGVTPHLYVEGLTVTRALGLSPAGEGEPPHVVVWEPATPETVFRATPRIRGAAVADVVQCWLDTYDHPGRGRSQADYLAKTALATALEQE